MPYIKKRRRKRVRQRVLWSMFVVCCILIIAGSWTYANFRNDLSARTAAIYEPIKRPASDNSSTENPNVLSKEASKPTQTMLGQQPFAILLLGIDTEEGETGRSDAIVLLTINPKTESLKMLSIPRDTYAYLPDKGTEDKINHAFAYDGMSGSVSAVEHLLDIPIKYAAQVNMSGIKDIVDAFGGITVNNYSPFTFGEYVFEKGPHHVNGEEALAFMRMRKEDPYGDLGRQDRQRQVLQSLAREAAAKKDPRQIDNLLKTIEPYLKTNLTLEEIRAMYMEYRTFLTSIEQFYLVQGKGEMIDGVWYYRVNEAELEEVKGNLKVELEL